MTAMPITVSFDRAWREMERQGYRYGRDALGNVRLGWNLRDKLGDAQLELYKASAPLCDKHQPRGGTRGGCLVCALDEQHAALSRIDYAMGPPNEMGVSGYDVHCAWQAVELRAKHLRFALIGVRDSLRSQVVRSAPLNDLLEQIELLNL